MMGYRFRFFVACLLACCCGCSQKAGELDFIRDIVVETSKGKWMCRVRITEYTGVEKTSFRHPLLIYSDELAIGAYPDVTVGSRKGHLYDTLLGKPVDMVEGSIVYCDLTTETFATLPGVEWPLEIFKDKEKKKAFLKKFIEECEAIKKIPKKKEAKTAAE